MQPLAVLEKLEQLSTEVLSAIGNIQGPVPAPLSNHPRPQTTQDEEPGSINISTKQPDQPDFSQPKTNQTEQLDFPMPESFQVQIPEVPPLVTLPQPSVPQSPTVDANEQKDSESSQEPNYRSFLLPPTVSPMPTLARQKQSEIPEKEEPDGPQITAVHALPQSPPQFPSAFPTLPNVAPQSYAPFSFYAGRTITDEDGPEPEERDSQESPKIPGVNPVAPLAVPPLLPGFFGRGQMNAGQDNKELIKALSDLTSAVNGLRDEMDEDDPIERRANQLPPIEREHA